MCTGAVTHLSCIIALLLWKPNPDQLAVFFVFSGLWGMADAVWQTQNNGEYPAQTHFLLRSPTWAAVRDMGWVEDWPAAGHPGNMVLCSSKGSAMGTKQARGLRLHSYRGFEALSLSIYSDA